MPRKKLTKAMILAAGLGTRLRTLTMHTPKALVKFEGIPLIEHVVKKLILCGIEEIVVNTHYLAEQLNEYFDKNDFGIKINLSFEKEILGTGGGIKNARNYLNDTEYFLVYNVDVISDINLNDMCQFHVSNYCFATLAVKKRSTSRPLLFDLKNNLTGRIINNEIFRSGNEKEEVQKAFCGAHIISSKIFDYFPDESSFDIIPIYLDLIKKGKVVQGYDIKDAFWEDMGKYNNSIS